MLIIVSLIISYLIASNLNNRLNKDIAEARGRDTKAKRKIDISKLKTVNKMRENKNLQSIFTKRAAKLKKLGNPLKLTPLKYYLIKFIPPIIAFLVITLLGGEKSLITAAIVIPFTFFYIDISYYLRNKEDNKEILLELPRIYKMLIIQSYAEVPLEQTLIEIFDVVKNERFKSALVDLGAEITIKKNLELAIDNLTSKFKLDEIDGFALAIKQSAESGKSRDFLENQGDLLDVRAVNETNIGTANNKLKVAIATMGLFIGIGALVLFSFSTQIFKDIQNIINI